MDKVETCSEHLLDTVGGYEMNATMYKVSRMPHTRKGTESMATEVKQLSCLIQFTGEQHLQLQYHAELIMCKYV